MTKKEDGKLSKDVWKDAKDDSLGFDKPKKLKVEKKKKDSKGTKVAEVPEEFSERIDISREDIYPKDMIDRHISRYEWAVSRLKDRMPGCRAVLDYGCGTGYGTKMLLKCAKGVYGVDVSIEAVRRAAKTCLSGCLKFNTASETSFPGPEDLKLGLTKYDAVVCIEVFEHLEKRKEFLSRLFKMTRKNGVLLMTTPERPKDKGPDWKPTNKYHIKEYSVEEFKSEVEEAGWSINNVDTDRVPGFIFLEATR